MLCAQSEAIAAVLKLSPEFRRMAEDIFGPGQDAFLIEKFCLAAEHSLTWTEMEESNFLLNERLKAALTQLTVTPP